MLFSRLLRCVGSFVVLAALLVSVPAGAVDGTEPVTTVAGIDGNGSGANQLDLPYGVAVGADGAIYIADTFNNRVQKIADGIETTVAGGNGQGSGPNQLDTPRAVAVGADGAIYIADTYNHRVQKIADGIETTVAGGNGQGSGPNQLDTPFGVALGADGAIYIADLGNDRVQKIADGIETTVAGGNGQGSGPNQLYLPFGVAVGADGAIYIADTYNHRVQKIADGIETTLAGGNGQGSGPNQLNNPYGVAVEADGSLYIADSDNHRVQKIADGVETTVAGTTGSPGSGPNQLNLPFGMAVGADGSLYIVDTNNSRVQKLTAFDATDPTITITSPAADTTFAHNATAAIEFACADEGTAGLDTCTAKLNGNPVATGTTINTTIAGSNTLVVTAVDNAANTTTKTITFAVAAAAPVVPDVGPRELTGTYAGMSGIEGSTARLYMAVFKRQPDAGGHTYWVNRANNGLSLRETVDYFIGSPEFVDTYATLDDPAFIDLLYLNVMNRAGDTDGVRFWNEQLDNGMERSVIVLLFSESPEFKELTGTT